MAFFNNPAKSSKPTKATETRAFIWQNSPSPTNCPTNVCPVTVSGFDIPRETLRYEETDCATGQNKTVALAQKPIAPFELTISGKLDSKRDALWRAAFSRCETNLALVTMCANDWETAHFIGKALSKGISFPNEFTVSNVASLDNDTLVHMIEATFESTQFTRISRTSFTSSTLVSGAVTATNPLSSPIICPRYDCTDCNGNSIGDECGAVFVLEAAAGRVWYKNALGAWQFFTITAPLPTMLRCTETGLMIVRPPAVGTGTTYTIVGYNAIPANATALSAATVWTTVSANVMNDVAVCGGYAWFAGTTGQIVRVDLRTSQITTTTAVTAQTLNDIACIPNSTGGYTVVAVGNVGAAVVSTDGLSFALATFLNANTLIEVRLFDSSNAVIADSVGNRYYWSSTGFVLANNWQNVTPYTSVAEIQLQGNVGFAIGIAGGIGVVTETVDGGCTWGNALATGTTLPVTLTAVSGIAICPTQPDTVIATGTTNTGAQVVLTGTGAI